MKKLKIAIIYDFDGTLAKGNMQESSFIPDVCKMSIKDFWTSVQEDANKHNADQRLCYMYKMIQYAKHNNHSLERKAFQEHGKKVVLFDGVSDWFNRINQYAKELKIDIHHFIISSGNKELIEGTTIKKYFTEIFACEFYYDQHGVAIQPAVTIDYTNKTQYLFRINKNIYHGDKGINDYTADDERDIPFSNMIYIGDGDTDIPCMKLVKEKGGFSIGVHDGTKKKKADVQQLAADGRVNFVTKADYTENAIIMDIVRKVIKRMHATYEVSMVIKKQSK